MVFRYHVSPLPPVIGICLKDVHRLDVQQMSQLDEPVLLGPFYPLLSWLPTHTILRCSRLVLLSRISAVPLSLLVFHSNELWTDPCCLIAL